MLVFPADRLSSDRDVEFQHLSLNRSELFRTWGRGLGMSKLATTKTVTSFAAATIALLLASPLVSSPAGAGSITRMSSFAYDATSGLLIQEVVEPDQPSLRL